MKRAFAAAWAAVLLCTPLGCSRPAGTEFAENLRGRITVEAMTTHLGKLQQIADAHGGNRAVGTPGYDASADYVAEVLRGNGFDVQTPDFEVRVFSSEKPVLTVGGAQIEADALKFSLGTPAEGISGPLVVAADLATSFVAVPIHAAAVASLVLRYRRGDDILRPAH